MGLIEHAPERTTAWVCGQRGCDNYGELARLVCTRSGHGREIVYVRADLHRGAVDRIAELERENRALADAAEIYAVAIEATGIELPSRQPGRVKEAENDADAASFQAAFWRARAIELGASEDEFRKTHLGGQ